MGAQDQARAFLLGIVCGAAFLGCVVWVVVATQPAPVKPDAHAPMWVWPVPERPVEKRCNALFEMPRSAWEAAARSLTERTLRLNKLAERVAGNVTLTVQLLVETTELKLDAVRFAARGTELLKCTAEDKRELLREARQGPRDSEWVTRLTIAPLAHGYEALGQGR